MKIEFAKGYSFTHICPGCLLPPTPRGGADGDLMNVADEPSLHPNQVAARHVRVRLRFLEPREAIEHIHRAQLLVNDVAPMAGLEWLRKGRHLARVRRRTTASRVRASFEPSARAAQRNRECRRGPLVEIGVPSRLDRGTAVALGLGDRIPGLPLCPVD